MGLYVTVGGIDGSGTTSVVEGLNAVDRLTVSEPTETWLGGVVREGFEERDLDAVARFYLFMADRANVREQLESLVEDGATIISDRGPDSTRAYQYGGRECVRCGYISFNDEIGKEEDPSACPECGARLIDRRSA